MDALRIIFVTGRVSGVIESPRLVADIRRVEQAAAELWERGLTAVMIHSCVKWSRIDARQAWAPRIDNLIRQCHAMLVTGDTDAETERQISVARQADMNVFHRMPDLLAWAEIPVDTMDPEHREKVIRNLDQRRARA